MSIPFILLWVFVAASVVGTGALWLGVRKVSRDGWPRRIQTVDHAEQEAAYRQQQIDQQKQREFQKRAVSEAQRRRDDARARCELLFTVYAPEIGNRFTKPMLDAFIQNYMGDNRSPDEVEERSRQLEEILNTHRTAVKPAPRFKDIEELANWYVAEKRRIENLPVDPMFKEQHLVQLHMQYAELTQQVMEQQS